MDVRDVKFNGPYPANYLLGIWDLQLELVKDYIKIEGLPPYPLNLDLKESQTLLKDFISRVIEELCEAHEYLITPDSSNELMLEEYADALHFFMELFIYIYPNFRDFERDFKYHDWGTRYGVPSNFLESWDLTKYDPEILKCIEVFYITYHLNIARNALRNKPWKQTEVKANTGLFYKHVMTAFKIFIDYIMPVSDEEKFSLYYRKNHINKFRIKSKY